MATFTLRSEYLFWRDVTVTPPGADQQTFKACFKYLPEDEQDAALKGGDDAFFAGVLRDVADVEVEGDQPKDLVAELLRHSWVRKPLAEAYFAGVLDAQRGNSKPSARPGAAPATKQPTT